MYHFLSGYTAKVAGTEAGVVEPQTTFSACFGAPFLPLHATEYAQMLGERMTEHGSACGWSIRDGQRRLRSGTSHEIVAHPRDDLGCTRRGELDQVETMTHPVFKIGGAVVMRKEFPTNYGTSWNMVRS